MYHMDESIYLEVYNLVTSVWDSSEHNLSQVFYSMLDPESNSTTRKFMMSGYDLTESKKLSLTLTLLLELQLRYNSD